MSGSPRHRLETAPATGLIETSSLQYWPPIAVKSRDFDAVAPMRRHPERWESTPEPRDPSGDGPDQVPPHQLAAEDEVELAHS